MTYQVMLGLSLCLFYIYCMTTFEISMLSIFVKSSLYMSSLNSAFPQPSIKIFDDGDAHLFIISFNVL